MALVTSESREGRTRWIRHWIGLAAGVAVLTAVAPGSLSSQESPTAGWDLRLTWNTSADTTQVNTVSADQPLRLVCQISGADSLQGFQIMLRTREVGGTLGSSWLFRDSLGCRAATFEATAQGDEGATAPWQRKLILTDVRYGQESGGAVMIIAGAFDLAVLDPDSSYILCTIDILPPSAGETGECPGWDSPAVFNLVAAKVLHGRSREFPLDVPPTMLAVRLKN
jgi:hypothetical protein